MVHFLVTNLKCHLALDRSFSKIFTRICGENETPACFS